MFGISFDELLVVIVVGVFFLNKKDMPELARFYKSSVKKFTSIKREVRSNFVSLHNDFVSIDEDTPEDKSLQQTEKPVKNGFVVADDGKLHPCFDIEELKDKKK